MRLCLLELQICFASLAICTKSSRHRSTRSPTSGSWRFTLPSTIADAQPAHMAITCSTSNVLVMFLICDATSGSIRSGFLMAYATRVGGGGPFIDGGTKGSATGFNPRPPWFKGGAGSGCTFPTHARSAYVLPPPAPSTPSGAIRSQSSATASPSSPPAIARHSALRAS